MVDHDERVELMRAAYVDDQLLATGKVNKAAIIGKQGGIWAASSGYQVGHSYMRICLQVQDTGPAWCRGKANGHQSGRTSHGRKGTNVV